jgi:hypothetical protein
MPLITNETAAIKLTPQQEAEVAQLPSTAEIIRYMHERQIEQGLIKPDNFDARGENYYAFQAVDQPQAKSVAKSVTVNGVKYIIEGATEDELVSNELALMKKLFGQPSGTEPQRDSAGRFVRQPSQEELDGREAQRILDEQAAREAATIDPAAAALAPSVVAALRAAGIDPDALRTFTETQRAEAYTQSWADAATAFGEKHPEFPRGEENKEILGRIISDNNLMDAADKLQAMEAAYAYAIKHKAFVEPSEEVEARQIAEAQTPAELQALLRAKGHLAPIDVRGGGSGFWGR